jgi:MFS transporter, DHA1 family, multidrug resistance protein
MIIVLGVMVALGPLTIDMYLPALPKIADDLTGTLAGLALGQLIVGPLSDSLGRRRPLMAGIVLHMVASVICMLATNVVVLGLARMLQGFGAAAGMVVAIAVVGDLFSGSAAATVLSRLMLVLGVAPVVAPSLGAAVLLHGSWHWVFAALVVSAGALLIVAALALPETLPSSHRRPLRVRGIAATYLELLRDTRFVILVLVAALGMSGLFAYIAGASFVLQGTYGLDQQSFALVFGAGAVALIGATQFNVVLLKRFSPQAITLWALAAALLAAGVFVGLSVGHVGGLAGFVVPVWAILAAMGLVIPNAPAVALSRHPDAAGTAAALLGAAQFGLGAAVAPLVGVLGNDEVALSVVMAVGALVALLALLSVGVVATSDNADESVPDEAVSEPA